nr:thioredoxin TrxC [Burkholderiales bacterium]
MSEYSFIVCPGCTSVNRVPHTRMGEAPKCGKCRAPLFQGRPVPVDAAGFDRHVRNDTIPVIVDFWAAWCGPCKMMAPLFEKAASEFEPRARLIKLDTEAESSIAARYGIRSIPTFAI